MEFRCFRRDFPNLRGQRLARADGLAEDLEDDAASDAASDVASVEAASGAEEGEEEEVTVGCGYGDVVRISLGDFMGD